MSTDTIASVLTKLKSERAELEARIAKLDVAIGAIEEVVGNAARGASQSGQLQLSQHAFRGKSISKAAKAYLRMAGRNQTTREITDALMRGGIGKRNLRSNVVYGVLKREEKVKKDVIRTGDAWALSEWSAQQQ